MNPLLTYTPAKLYSGKGDWYVYFFVTDPSTGKKKMFQRTGKMNYIHNKKQKLSFGKMLCQEINSLLNEGWSPLGNTKSVLNLMDLMEQMFEIRKPLLRPRSIQSYDYCIKTFKEWAGVKEQTFIYPEQFDIKLCHSFCDWLLTEKKIKGRNFNNHKTIIGSLFNMMEDREIISKNPFRKIKSFPKTQGKNTPFTDEVKQALIDEMILKDYRLYLFTQFIYYCFIRPAELVRLKVGNIDLKNKKITLSGSQTKNKKNGFVVIPDAFIPIVESMQLEKINKDYFIFGALKKQSLVPSAFPLSRNAATNHFLKIRKGLNLSNEITLYGWKDSGVCSAYKQGISLYRIMSQCRHSSLTQTQTYLNSLGLESNIEFGSKMK